jgi:hypothetical protein
MMRTRTGGPEHGEANRKKDRGRAERGLLEHQDKWNGGKTPRHQHGPETLDAALPHAQKPRHGEDEGKLGEFRRLEIDRAELDPALGSVRLLADVRNVAGDEQQDADGVKRGRNHDQPAIWDEREAQIDDESGDDIGDLGVRRVMKLLVAVGGSGDGEDAGDA